MYALSADTIRVPGFVRVVFRRGGRGDYHTSKGDKVSEAYEKMKRPPESALRKIEAGTLKGKTDINPQWRYEIMDATFGACGIGWKYEIIDLWNYATPDGTVLAFAKVNVYVKNGIEWSDPVPGVGGNTLVDMCKGYNENDPKRAVPNDEGYKMAITDAIGTALKMIGVAADIYAGRWDGTKYRDEPKEKKADDKTLAEKKSALIDWLQADPPVFTDAQRKYAEDAIATNNIAAMDKAIDGAKKKAGETKV
jgi:hypothetical protein